MNTKFLLFFCAALFLLSCKKSSTEPNPEHETPKTYINTSVGSSWTYHEKNSSGQTPVNSDYTLTSTANDTSINSKTFHIYNLSHGGSQYLNYTENTYYQYDSIPGGLGQIFERIYLKDNAGEGSNWKQDISVKISNFITIPVTVSNIIMEKGKSRTVNGINYSNVIHVSTTISSSLIPAASLTSDIHSYYAPNYGLIENTSVVNLNYSGITQNVNMETKLVSAVLK